MTGRAGICSKSLTEVCAREAAVATADAALTNPTARVALRLFGKAASQWNTDMGQRVGLLYPSVWDLAERLRIDVDEELIAYVQVLEMDEIDADVERAPRAPQQTGRQPGTPENGGAE